MDFQPTTGEQVVREQFYGLTKREYFAAKALPQVIAVQFELGKMGETTGLGVEESAEKAVEYADALIAALNKPAETGEVK